MAGIWLSVLLFGLLILLTVIVLANKVSSGDINIEKNSVLRIDLSGIVEDRTTAPGFMDLIQDNIGNQLSLSDIVNAIRSASSDDRIDGILLECNGAGIGLAQCEEIINALKDFKKSGKWLWAYSDNYSQSDYFIASTADSVFLNPVGMIDIHGIAAQTFFFKDLMDKIGVEAQVVKVGTYKSAVEPFLLNSMSEANRQQVSHFAGRIWDNIAGSIASARNVSVDTVNAWADSFAFSLPAEKYLKENIIDALKYRREIDELVSSKTSVEDPEYIDFKDYCTAMATDPMSVGKAEKRVAVLYALGDITESDDDGIASDRLVPQILEIADDENIDGLILRVNSGGGSAFASEQIWEALQQFKKQTGKPFYVSMGDMAASGGYYISCGADRIFASPLTLTGSIGIFGIIPNIQPLMKEKLGVNVETVETNRGNFPTITAPMGPEQRQAMQNYVDRGYELFVSRCAEGRGMTVDQIKEIAEGRVWDGLSALENGLVDDLGGLRKALDDMAAELGTDFNGLDIVEYPETELQWWEPLMAMDGKAAAMIMGGNTELTTPLMLHLLRKVSGMHPLQCRTSYIYLK